MPILGTQAGQITGNLTPAAIGLFMQGNTAVTGTTSVEYIIITTTGNGTNFGNLTYAAYGNAGCASSTRGINAGGAAAGGYSNKIDYVTIATSGTGTSFGNMPSGVYGLAACSSATRGVFAGGI